MHKNNKLFERITPENSALVLIDHQVGILSTIKTIEPDILKSNVLALVKLAKTYNIPVVLTTNRSTGPNGVLIEEFLEMLPHVQVIDRIEINAWDDKNFVELVEKTDRNKLLMAGIITDVCLAFPALAAVEAGYDVYGILDASGTWNHLIEQAAMMRMAQAGVKLTNWVAIAAELQRNFTLPVENRFRLRGW